MGEKIPFEVKDPKLDYLGAELAILQKIPLQKLKLLESVFKNMSEVAQETGGLDAMNQMFQTMKSGEIITAPWRLFLKRLQMESTKEAVDSLKELIEAIQSEDFQNVIKETGKSFGQIIAGSADFIKFFVDFRNSIDETGKSFERANTELGGFISDIGTGIEGAGKVITDALWGMSEAVKEWNVVGEEFNEFFEDATEAISRKTQAEYTRLREEGEEW